MNKTLKLITAYIFLWLPICLISAVWNGFVVSKLILWFFNHIMSIPVAIGLSLIVQLLRPIGVGEDNRSPNNKIAGYVNTLFVLPTMGLIIGWVVKQFI